MLESDRYSDQITPDEWRLGFRVMMIQPSIIMKRHIDEPETASVVLTMGLSDRIVKIVGPTLTYYVHDHQLPTGSWITIPSISITPQQAIDRLDIQERWASSVSSLLVKSIVPSWPIGAPYADRHTCDSGFAKYITAVLVR